MSGLKGGVKELIGGGVPGYMLLLLDTYKEGAIHISRALRYVDRKVIYALKAAGLIVLLETGWIGLTRQGAAIIHEIQKYVCPRAGGDGAHEAGAGN